MNKWLIVALLISASLCIGLFAYYFFEQQITQAVPDIGVQEWTILEPKVVADCKKVDLAGDNTARVSFFTKLFSASGESVTYDAAKDDYFPAMGRAAYLLDLNPKDNSKCWVAWVGDATGSGAVVYETTDGNLKTLQVNSFPSPFRSK